MSLIKRNGQSIPTIPALFDDFFNRELFNWGNNNFSSTSTTVPSVNVRETADNYEVALAVPGMDKTDFTVTLDGNLLTISSSKEKKKKKTTMVTTYAGNLATSLSSVVLNCQSM